MLCLLAPESSNGRIRINWDYRHTGGLSLTKVTVEYRQDQIETFQLLPMDSTLQRKSFEALNLTAGYTYIFRISASNENGSDNIECPPVRHAIGNSCHSSSFVPIHIGYNQGTMSCMIIHALHTV